MVIAIDQEVDVWSLLDSCKKPVKSSAPRGEEDKSWKQQVYWPRRPKTCATVYWNQLGHIPGAGD